MSSKVRSCILRSFKNPPKNVVLPHNQPVIIGRNEDTGITDLHVSRNHLQCTADYDTERVIVKTLGRCFAGCNGYALIQGNQYTLKHGDQLEVRLGSHNYEIVFEKAPIEDSTEPALKKPKLEQTNSCRWEEIEGRELLIYTSENCQSQAIIASFDLDGTLIKTKSGLQFPKDANDWEFNFSNIPKKLKQLYDNGKKIVIFTNQAGLRKDSSKIDDFKQKIETIIKQLATPCQVFIATGRSIYRKPAPGMWNVLIENKNDNIKIDMEQSFFVGDAAGREDGWALKKKKDHSIGDRLFALNIGLKFLTPEEFFQNSKAPNYKMPNFDPRSLSVLDYPDLKLTQPEMVVMVGSPGSGKSYFTKSLLVPKGYIYISRDKLGSWQKCVKLAEEALRKQQSVVIDNTNPDKETRQRYIDVAKKFDVQCRCFVMDTTFEHAKHNNRFRELTDKTHTPINEIILRTYKKSYEEPDKAEGFCEILRIPFVANFDNNEHEKLYKSFLLEK